MSGNSSESQLTSPPQSKGSVPSTLAVDASAAVLPALKTSLHALGHVQPAGHLGDQDYLTWIRQYDWASSVVGPITTWSDELKRAYEMALASPDPICILWESGVYAMLYNQSYANIIGEQHPQALGRPLAEHFESSMPVYESIFSQIESTGQPLKHVKIPRFMHKGGFLEEVYIDVVFTPVLARDSTVAGMYSYVADSTAQVLSERRMRTLLKVNNALAPCKDLGEIWRKVETILADLTGDINFLSVYTSTSKHHTVNDSPSELTMQAASGIHPGWKGTARSATNLSNPDVGPVIQKAFDTMETIELSSIDGSLTPAMSAYMLAHGVVEHVRQVVVEPISCDLQDCNSAVLSIGVNPLRKFDDDFRLFMRLRLKQIESAITTIRNMESQKGLIEAQIALDTQGQFMRFAERSSVGFYWYNSKGEMTFCNEEFCKIAGKPYDELIRPMGWMDSIHPDDQERLQHIWDDIICKGIPQTFSVQFKKPWVQGEGQTGRLDRTWGLATSYPEVSADGKVQAVIGCVADVSSVKWAEQIQAEKLAEALELKRQQENFLDTTSHEMRNPLNSIFHCAAELVEQLGEIEERAADRAADRKVLAECVSMAETIIYCANHQKRIVDDVLTLSKMDSRLLQIFPTSYSPPKLVNSVLSIFAAELSALDISTDIALQPGYDAMAIKAVLLDTHRISQCLINLLSNAVKFTKAGTTRHLRLLLDASSTVPDQIYANVQYVHSGSDHPDPTSRAVWGDGEILYVTFSIQDTGAGMTPEEIALLFGRFAQANPRTHTQYGGSGLGLFISRELAEMHGGRIGVSSESGVGSIFTFYVKARRDTAVTADAVTPAAAPPPIDAMSKLHVKTPPAHDVSSPERPKTKAATRTPDRKSGQKMTLEAEAVSTRAEGVETAQDPAKTSVLVVEDNLVNQRILKKLLIKHGFEVRVANHGEEALAVISGSTWSLMHARSPTDVTSDAKSPPVAVVDGIMATPAGLSPVDNDAAKGFRLDIVLCDVEMPVCDGKEFVRRVRQLQGQGLLAAGIPVVAVTGNARGELVQEALSCGFSALVTKPYKIGDLLDVARKCLREVEDGKVHSPPAGS